MPAIVATSLRGSGIRSIVETTLDGSNSFTYEPGDILILRNPTGGVINPLIDGADGTVWPADGIGDVTVSGGYVINAIAAGVNRCIPLDTIRAYCQGTVAITSATGLVAAILRR